MPICYPRLVQTGLHQTDFPTLCWFETDRLRMGGVVRHTQHTFRNTDFGIPGLLLAMTHGAPAHPRGSRHTNTYLGVAKQVSPDPIHSMDTHRNSSILSV